MKRRQIERHLNTTDVATILGVVEKTVIRYCEAGKFPNAYRVKPDAKTSPWLIPSDDVRFFQSQLNK